MSKLSEELAEELKERIDWFRNLIGPRNADRLKADVDDLVKALQEEAQEGRTK